MRLNRKIRHKCGSQSVKRFKKGNNETSSIRCSCSCGRVLWTRRMRQPGYYHRNDCVGIGSGNPDSRSGGCSDTGAGSAISRGRESVHRAGTGRVTQHCGAGRDRGVFNGAGRSHFDRATWRDRIVDQRGDSGCGEILDAGFSNGIRESGNTQRGSENESAVASNARRGCSCSRKSAGDEAVKRFPRGKAARTLFLDTLGRLNPGRSDL